ncbi:hypothetical protein ACFYKT_08675 [Cytobacillus sp. FJAT-53684]|uniref:Phr family secreted Rap phosphatase inhibitor n=1 Tax=Cytobacillus mangrovibacter TaxID=3299024 RepID=A0ABW6JX23_9BACI
MKKIIVKGALGLGILSMGFFSTHIDAHAGYPTQHSIDMNKAEIVQPGIGTFGYPTQH